MEILLENRTIHSESVMLSGAAPDGSHYAAVRVCTYPDAGVAWLWGMVLTPAGFHQFASNDIAWRGGLAGEGDSASYAVNCDAAQARFARRGFLARPTQAGLDAAFESLPALGDAQNPVAAGRVTVAATFTPREGYAGLLPGRTEAFGHAAFRCTIDGQPVSFAGPAQFHEQAQSAPRFTTPFAFSSLWSDDLYATLLDVPQGGGYIMDGGAAHPLTDVHATLTPDALALAFTRDSTPHRIALDAARIYRVPVYGRHWTGRFVRGAHAGRTLVGFLNSWDR